MQLRWMLPASFGLATAISLQPVHGTTSIARTTATLNVPAGRSATTSSEPVNYRVVRLPTLGGTEAFNTFIDDQGRVTGTADLTGGRYEQAFLWQDNEIRVLGTLGGANSEAWEINAAGAVVGNSVTSTVDPIEEDYCQYTVDGKLQDTDRTCLGFLLSHGVKTTLPTLGGNNDQVFGLNNRGQMVGTAETGAHDPTCIAPQVLDFEAVIWGPNGRIQELRPLVSDAIGVAIGINDKGDVVGTSGFCATLTFAVGVHALLWQEGKPIYLGGFGGQMNNVAWHITNHGQVVGFSDLPGDTTTHAFLWRGSTGMIDLGTLLGDSFSFAFGANERGQVVGQSCDASFNCRAFIWQDGVMSDLNTLVSPSSALYLTLAWSINESGEISGTALDRSTGDSPVFVAIPTHGYEAHPRPKVTLPPYSVRKRLLQRPGFGRFGQ